MYEKDFYLSRKAKMQHNKEFVLGSTESTKLYVLNSDAMAFLSIHSVLKELQNKECAIIDVKSLSIERYFYFIQQHGQAEGLTNLFIKYAKHYNFR